MALREIDMPEMLGYLLLFTGVGVAFIFVNLMVGKLIRPAKMNVEKGAIYECGEPTVGSAWVQFDLRFYVVALLFVIFDVEMAFFFPWAVVFGRSVDLADPNLPLDRRAEIVAQMPQAEPTTPESLGSLYQRRPDFVDQTVQGGSRLAWVAFVDILFFFGVLLVGFAYLWKRGDLNWVRSTAAQSGDASVRRASPNGDAGAREQLAVLTRN
jgi:NADH-quinone oxidoreductase subunit A